MAKLPPKAEGMSRVKFIMLEAELPAGDIQQFTQAIQSALRPANTGQTRVIAAIPSTPRLREASDEQISEIDIAPQPDLEGEEPDGVELPSLKKVTPGKPRKYRTPKVVSEIDPKGEPSWADFVAMHVADSIHEKYLTAAAWLKEKRHIDPVNVDHIYTCFRFANWPTNLQDFSQPLRQLRADQLMDGPAKGQFRARPFLKESGFLAGLVCDSRLGLGGGQPGWRDRIRWTFGSG